MDCQEYFIYNSLRIITINKKLFIWGSTKLDAQTVAAAGMRLDQARLDSLSHNLVNALTPGYKRQISVAQPFAAHLTAQGFAGPASAVLLDPRPGTLKATGQLLDVAIEGDAYFALEVDGQSLYSRSISLKLDTGGRLVDQAGRTVLGRSGPVVLASAPFEVAANGEIFQQGRQVDQLRLVTMRNAHLARSAGAGLYASEGAEVLSHAGSARVRAGFQEMSNVSSAAEMVRLTETVRHFEALQKVVSGHDGMLETAIRKLGEF